MLSLIIFKSLHLTFLNMVFIFWKTEHQQTEHNTLRVYLCNILCCFNFSPVKKFKSIMEWRTRLWKEMMCLQDGIVFFANNQLLLSLQPPFWSVTTVTWTFSPCNSGMSQWSIKFLTVIEADNPFLENSESWMHDGWSLDK